MSTWWTIGWRGNSGSYVPQVYKNKNGAGWESVTIPIPASAYSGYWQAITVCAVDEEFVLVSLVNTHYLSTPPGVILLTEDGGETWSTWWETPKVDPHAALWVRGIKAFDRNNIFWTLTDESTFDPGGVFYWNGDTITRICHGTELAPWVPAFGIHPNWLYLTAITGSSPSDIWVVDYFYKYLFHWNGTSWDRGDYIQYSNVGYPKQMDSAGVNNTYVATWNFTNPGIAHWNGVSWTQEAVGYTTLSVHAVSADEIYAAAARYSSGWTSHLLKWDGVSWSNIEVFGGTWLCNIFKNESIIYGLTYEEDGPAIIKWDGVSWTDETPIGYAGNLIDIAFAESIFYYSSPFTSHQIGIIQSPAREQIYLDDDNSRTVWNEFDEHGLIVGLPRLKAEKNWEYKRRLKDVMIHRSNSTYRGLVHGITRELGLSLFSPIQINPRRNENGAFYADDPYIKFDGAYLYLYSDYKNGTLDHKIDRYERGGNYEHLIRLIDFINETTYFEASLETGYDPYIKSMTILNQSNRDVVYAEDVQVSTRFKLDKEYIVDGSLITNNRSIFGIEKSTVNNVSAAGNYFIDYKTGIVTLYQIPTVGTAVRYEYSIFPFKPIASPIILYDINNDNFRTKLFNQILQDDGTYSHGLPTELGTDIINELMSITPMYWGI
jgi:hypothetical protein